MKKKSRNYSSVLRLGIVGGALFVVAAGSLVFFSRETVSYSRIFSATSTPSREKPTLDTAAYDRKMLQIALGTTTIPAAATSTATSTPQKQLWPVKAPYPKAGALLPFNRILAYYGNFYSKGMGVLGQYPEEEMLSKLRAEVKRWEAADPTTPVIPAIHYIVVTAQASAQRDGTYRARMPDDQIDKALALAGKVHGIVFIDFQVGLSTLQKELPIYEEYLSKPNVHLGIDPEFSMKSGAAPGKQIGVFDAADVNYAAEYLAKLVQEHDLPPKILVIHRFTQGMLTNYRSIRPLPEVQIVMDMDGWGFPAKKVNTYKSVIYPEPVQFAGFKLFYKNDTLPPSPGIMTPEEVLKLRPQPIYIQYQ